MSKNLVQKTGEILDKKAFAIFFPMPQDNYTLMTSQLEGGRVMGEALIDDICALIPYIPPAFIKKDAVIKYGQRSDGTPGIFIECYIFSPRSLKETLREIKVGCGDFSIKQSEYEITPGGPINPYENED